MGTTLLLLLTLLVSLTSAAITDQTINDPSGQLLARVFDSNKVSFVNRHRGTKPQLKISLNGGATIEKVDPKPPSSWTLTLSDQTSVELTLTEPKANQTKIHRIWIGSDPARELCFHYETTGTFWYGTQNSKRPKWPMSTTQTVSKTPFNFLLHDYWLDDGGEFKRINELLYFTSDGFGILLDSLGPWFMHREPGTSQDPVICFSVNSTAPYNPDNSDPTYLDLKLHIFASSNIRAVSEQVVHESGLIPKPTQVPDEKMFQEPSWMEWGSQSDRSDKGILAFSHKLTELGLGKGEIFVPPMSINPDFGLTIDHVDKLVTDLHATGFRFGYTFFVSAYDMLFQERNADWNNTYRYPEPFADFSNETVSKWYGDHLGKLHTDKHSDSYILYNFFGDPKQNYSDLKFQSHPNLQITNYVETVSKAVGPSGVYSFVGFRTQHLPVFIQTWNDEFDVKEHFAGLIPNVLSLSIAGYSFLAANPAGTPSTLDEEMYIRWVQATTFLPHMSFHQDPWDHFNSSSKVIDATKKSIELHAQNAPTFIELAKKRVATGEPIIRPMWYAEPEDPKSYSMGDQFLVGADLVVAPVLVEGQRERAVYLPSGEWIDQHGKSYQGPGEVKVPVPLEELAYFKRK